MIFDLLRDTPDPSLSADICIIGAGAAGIALAVECVRLGKQVTLLEAGGVDIEEGAVDTYRASHGAQSYRGMQQGRAKRLGGTTTLWGGQIAELDNSDFEPRSWIAGSGWPLRKSDLQQHYARALEMEGLGSAVLPDAAVWRHLGLNEPTFDELALYLSRWCPEPDFARLHRTTLQGAGISVWLHATATEAVCEQENVQGIRARTACGRQAVFRATTYVFCLGAIESIRFFLQPQDGPRPWSQSRLLGCHFQDHIDSNAATIIPINAQSTHRTFDTIFWKGMKYSPKLKLGVAMQRQLRCLNVGATVFSTEKQIDDLTELKKVAKDVLHGRVPRVRTRHVGAAFRSSPHLFRQAYRYAVQHRAYHSATAKLQLRVHCEQQPRGSSKIELSGEQDAFGMHRVHLQWNIAPKEIDTIRSFVQAARQALAPMARVIPHPALLQPDNRFAEQCEDSFHQMGGMRMDPSPRCGVVDTDLKLHGTSNCYVCSAAVYPGSGFSNPTHTLIALAMRLATHLDR